MTRFTVLFVATLISTTAALPTEYPRDIEASSVRTSRDVGIGFGIPGLFNGHIGSNEGYRDYYPYDGYGNHGWPNYNGYRRPTSTGYGGIYAGFGGGFDVGYDGYGYGPDYYGHHHHHHRYY